MKIKYRNVRLSKLNISRLIAINDIIAEYQRDGYKLTLRQLYYQLVSRDIILNEQKEYAKLSTLLKEGRMSGMVDWEAIEDRLRRPSKPSSWETPKEIIESAIHSYELPRMKGQRTYVEVWVEKDALSGVLSRVTEPFHIPIMVNRGYSSVTAMHDAYKRFEKAKCNKECQAIRVLYLGDFDPSGQDMIRDIEERICEFIRGDEGDYEASSTNVKEWYDFDIIPIALTREQIDEYEPPPNPAKTTDPRASKYIRLHGDTSWEVDALPPDVLHRLLNRAIMNCIDFDLYKKVCNREKRDIAKLKKVAQTL